MHLFRLLQLSPSITGLLHPDPFRSREGTASISSRSSCPFLDVSTDSGEDRYNDSVSSRCMSLYICLKVLKSRRAGRKAKRKPCWRRRALSRPGFFRIYHPSPRSECFLLVASSSPTVQVSIPSCRMNAAFVEFLFNFPESRLALRESPDCCGCCPPYQRRLPACRL